MTDRTDKELLIAAAKAAGYTVHGFVGDRFVVNFDDGTRGEWSPLTDDGDALRMAVKLNLEIRGRDLGRVTVAGNGCWEEVDVGGDVYAATRRAIVRAAAAIGGAG